MFLFNFNFTFCVTISPLIILAPCAYVYFSFIFRIFLRKKTRLAAFSCLFSFYALVVSITSSVCAFAISRKKKKTKMKRFFLGTENSGKNKLYLLYLGVWSVASFSLDRALSFQQHLHHHRNVFLLSA